MEGETSERLVDLGTHSLHIRCVGRGAPAVVIDTGHGDEAYTWYAIQDQLAEETRVCTYDRAGYGRSEPGPMPRHSRQAAELKLLLENAGIEGPYLLVGHSLGGLNAQVFAGDYPDLVAGLVLVDPPPMDVCHRQDVSRSAKDAGRAGGRAGRRGPSARPRPPAPRPRPTQATWARSPPNCRC